MGTGPQEVTAGPYKDIRLEIFNQRISDMHCSSELSSTLEQAVVRVEVEVEPAGSNEEVEVELRYPGKTGGHQRKTGARTSDSQSVKFDFVVDNPELWWPARYGEQPLYQVHTRLLSGVCFLPTIL